MSNSRPLSRSEVEAAINLMRKAFSEKNLSDRQLRKLFSDQQKHEQKVSGEIATGRNIVENWQRLQKTRNG